MYCNAHFTHIYFPYLYTVLLVRISNNSEETKYYQLCMCIVWVCVWILVELSNICRCMLCCRCGVCIHEHYSWCILRNSTGTQNDLYHLYYIFQQQSNTIVVSAENRIESNRICGGSMLISFFRTTVLLLLFVECTTNSTAMTKTETSTYRT